MSRAIGIDLGTVNSCVGVVKNGNIDIIGNSQGNRVTPSIVAFSGNKRLVGDAAKYQISQNPENTVYGVKRIIGRRFDNVSADDIKRWPFKVVNNDGPKIEVSFRNKREVFTPEQISAAVLTKMKQTAEDFLNDDVTDAVITVPAYFNDSQRQATKDAAEIAGLNVLRLINEPTAAAIAYGLKSKVSADQNILVFDMGGGTFDVSILAIDDELYQVKAVGGDTHLGGEDFNNKMLDYFLKEINQKYGKDLSDDKHAISELLVQCELAKIMLSTITVADVTVKALQSGFDFKSSMTRACFEELNAGFFKRAIEIVEKTIADAKLTKTEIHEVVLVGGSTYIPKVQEMLQKCFNGKNLNKSINPDEAVAYGAAVIAANLNNDADEISNFLLLDVIPYSLGIEHSGGLYQKIVQKNSTIPLEKISQRFSTARDNQTSVSIKIYEGESILAVENNFLGRFQLKGLTKAKARELRIEVKFKVNANGILEVSASESESGVENSLQIDVFRNGACGNADKSLSEEDIEVARRKIQTFNLLSNFKGFQEKQTSDFKYKNGIESFEAGNYEKAFEYFTEALETNPDLVEAMEKRAQIHFNRNEFEECVIECEEILKKKTVPLIVKLKIDAEKKRSKDESWWNVLNVAKNSTKSQVIDAYKKMVKMFHPDKTKSKLKTDKAKFTAKMAKINSAKQEFDKKN